MKKLLTSIPAKIGAVVLFLASALGAAFFALVVFLSNEFNFYEMTGEFYNVFAHPLNQGLYEDIYSNYDLFQFFYNWRYAAAPLAVALSVVCVVLLVFLLCAAGRREGAEGPVLSPLGRIPFDVLLACAGAAGLLLISLTIIALEKNIIPAEDDLGAFLLVCAAVGGLILLLVLWVVTSFATRVKAGKWWKNTLIAMVLRLVGRVLRPCGRFLLRLFRALWMEWRVTLGFVGYLLGNFVCFLIFLEGMDSFGEFFGFVLLCAVNLAALAVLVLGAHQFAVLKKAGEKLAAGELETKVDTKKMYFDYRRHGENLNSIGDGMSAAVEQRMRSERLKTELITNVSHDIKTPLTSIVNYVDLLQKPHSEEEGRQYLDVLARQSDRLRRLTLDLVEASKASTGNLPTELVPTNTAELISQAVAEYAERFARSGLEPVVTVPDKPVTVLADGRHLWRVLDNLLGNAVKYAQPGTRVYIDVRRLDGQGLISVKNISRDRLNVPAEELMERFVRGDRSRHTEGSGLGLSIALSLTELMGGTFNLTIDGDLFKAEVSLKEVHP